MHKASIEQIKLFNKQPSQMSEKKTETNTVTKM